MLVKQLVNKQRGVKLISGRILDIPPASVGNDFWLPWIFALVSVSLLKWAFFVSQLWLVSRVWGKGREEQMWLREETQRLVAGRRREEGKGVAWMGSIWKRRCLHIYFPLFSFFFFQGQTNLRAVAKPQSCRDHAMVSTKPCSWHRNDWLCWALFGFALQALCSLLSQQELQLRGDRNSL